MARRPRYEYKGIIVKHIVEEQLYDTYEKSIGIYAYSPVIYAYSPVIQKRGLKIKYEPLTFIPTKLYDAIDEVRKKKIREGEDWPIMSWTTFFKYLKEMVEDHTLIVHSRGGKNNETHYRLSERKLIAYLLYLLSPRMRSTFFTKTNFGNKPYAYFLVRDLVFHLIRRGSNVDLAERNISDLPTVYFSRIRKIR